MNFHRQRTSDPKPDPQLEQDLAALYITPTPTLEWRKPPAAAPRAANPGILSRLRKPAFALAAGAAVVAALVLVPMAWGGGAEPVSAQTIFERASQAAANATARTSYHLVGASTGDNGELFHTETWSRDSSHTRTESGDSGSHTETTSRDGSHTSIDRGDSGTIVNGDEFWLWFTINGQTRAVHAPSGAQAFAGQPGHPGSIAEVLAQYNDYKCQVATQDGEATVAGRHAYVITVSPKHSGCDNDGKVIEKSGLTLRLWVDTETFIPLKTETVAANGASIFTYEVTEMEVGQPIADSVFTYQPPSGVTVIEVTNAQEAKQALAADASPAAPANKNP